MNLSFFSFTVFLSIPIECIIRVSALIVFQVAEYRRFYTNAEIVGFVCPYGYEAGAHRPAVHIPGKITVHISKTVGNEIVTGRERERPVFCRLYASRYTQVLIDAAVVFHFFFVEITVTVVDGEVYG